MHARFWWENLKVVIAWKTYTGRNRRFLKKQDGRAWTKLTGLRIWTPVVSSCEHGKEP